MYKSPAGPPFIPGFPCPLSTTVWLSFIPAGILTLTFGDFLIVPLPWQFSHGSFIISPVPLHSEHGLVVWTLPKIVFWKVVTLPVPLHVGHFIGLI